MRPCTKIPYATADRLETAAEEFEEELENLDLPRNLRRQADNSHAHLRGWADVLRGNI